MGDSVARRLAQGAYDAYMGLTNGYAKPVPAKENHTKPRSKKLLYIVSRKPQGIVNLSQTIDELCGLSAYQFDLLNLYQYLPIDPKLDYNDYDGILVHNAVAYSPDIMRRIESRRGQKLRDYKGLKVMMKQDEHYRTGEMARYLGEAGFDLVLTICSTDLVPAFYPPEVVGQLEFMQYLTGYVPEHYRHLPYRADVGRSIDVGYRGSLQPLNFGRFTYEKQKIGYDFLPHARRRGLATDISSRWEDRYAGDAWLDFLGRCKGALGAESGSDIVDVDGEAERTYKAFMARHPKATPGEVFEVLAPFEGRLKYRGVSPRNFEAAACQTAQILYEDDFQGIFKPDLHYLPLKRDYSNVDDIIDRLLDETERKALCERAFEDIILNPAYSFKHFVAQFDAKLDELFEKKL